MAPTEPVKAGRGRPRKSIDSPATAKATIDTESSAQHGRGHPKGVIGAKVAKKPAVPGRGRGRPPKDPIAGPKPRKVPTGRGRGRPPGSGKKAAAAATPKKATKAGRGAPKKAGRLSNAAKEEDAAAEEQVDEEDEGVGKGQDDEEELGEDALDEGSSAEEGGE